MDVGLDTVDSVVNIRLSISGDMFPILRKLE